MEYGGEDLTGLLARHMKQNRADAEILKQNPHTLPSPSSSFALLESRFEEWQSRVRKMCDDALEANPAFQPIEVYGSGGGSYVHQWFRGVLKG